jgi:hypothetical protein
MDPSSLPLSLSLSLSLSPSLSRILFLISARILIPESSEKQSSVKMNLSDKSYFLQWTLQMKMTDGMTTYRVPWNLCIKNTELSVSRFRDIVWKINRYEIQSFCHFSQFSLMNIRRQYF